MPIGNGDLAANVWVEPNGDRVFYISKSDAWSGNGSLLKLGRVRVKLDEPLFKEGMKFSQELDLQNGTIRIESGGHDGARPSTVVSFWIDANNPVIHVVVESDKELNATAALEVWRTTRRELKGQEAVGAYGLLRGGPPIFEEPDTIIEAKDNTICWCHRNSKSCYEVTLKNQHLGHLSEKYPDPLINRTFGGLIAAENMVSRDDRTLATVEPVKNLHIKVYAHTAQTEKLDGWIKALAEIRRKADKTSLKKARKAHEEYWKEFWGRSWIYAKGDKDAEVLTRAYVLQRWIQTCAGRGKYPIKFNGSLFTVAGSDKGNWNADYRRWGGCYWFQNTRLAYWPMLYSGDFDQMEPLWKMYRDALSLLKDRTKKYYNHDGIFCSETMYFWGTYNNADFGWGNKNVHTVNNYIKYYWDSGNELSMMMLDYYSITEDEKFVKNTLLPIADNVVLFYDQHYRRNTNGKVNFSPAMSLETWHSAEDPLPVIIGLKTVLTRLLELPEKLTSDEQRKRWKIFLDELPEISFGEKDGKKWIKPARKYSNKKNSENPELYAVFPYRAYTQFKPDLEVALETWLRRLVKRTGGWTQDPIQAALLGLTNEAKGYAVQNAVNKHAGSRFPAFWGPNFDWIPDQDHGSVTLIAFQRMIMQTEGRKIYLAPAWPKEWACEFKLHAPYKTVIEGSVKDGKLINMNVSPESRRKDVEVMKSE